MTQSTQTIPVGYKQTEIGVIPEDWEVKKLGEFDLDISDGNYSSRYPKASEFKEQGIPFIRANNIKNLRVIDSELRFISNKLHSELIKGHLKKDDILITTRGEIGQIAIVPDRHIDSNINAQVVRINAGEKFNKYYFAYFLIKSDTQESLLNMQTGSALKQLPVGKLKELKIIYPSLPEQTAIATALSDTDTLIEKLEKLIDKKKAVKQGAMQQLLTGKKRLPGFSGEWDKKPVQEIGKTYGGLSGKVKADFGEGNSYYIPFMNIMSNPIIDITYFDKVNIKTNETQAKAQKNDLFFNGSSETPEEVGMCSVLLNEIPNLYLNSFCFGFRLNKDLETDGLWLSYFFRSSIGRELIYSLAQGATRYNLSKTNFLKLIIPYPEPEEQTAIATVLSDMDAEIEKLENKIGKYRQIKTGMMQQLLTGKIRLLKN